MVSVPPPSRKAFKTEASSSPPTAASLLSEEPVSAQSSTRSPSPISDVSQSIPEVSVDEAADRDLLYADSARDAKEDAEMANVETEVQGHLAQRPVEPQSAPGAPPGLIPSQEVYLQEAHASVPVVLLTPEPPQEQYQPSVQTQALMDDVISRREGSTPIYTIQSPYPDFEDLLAPFADGEFTYKLDVEMVIEVDDAPLPMTGVEDLLSLSNKMDGIKKTESYQGPFDPFVDNQLDEAVQAMSGAAAGGDVKTSRFSFAKGNGYDVHPRLPLGAGADYANVPSRSPSERHTAPHTHPYFVGKDTLIGATPPSRSALPFSLGVSSPVPNLAIPRTRTPSLAHPPPPPGLGLPQQQTIQQQQQHPSFPLYQNMTGGQQQMRTQHQGLNQQQHQLLTSLRDFHQPYAPERRTASPSLVQALRGGNANTQFAGRDMYSPAGESFAMQDPAIMAIRSGFPGAESQQPQPQQRQPAHRGQMIEQFSLPFDPSSPYAQQQQPGSYAGLQHNQTQQQQPSQQDMTPNARLLQQMHESMNAMAAGGNNGRSTPRSASRQAMSGRVY